MGNMANKKSGDTTSSIAGKVLKSGKATPTQAKKLAASVLSQDEIKGKNPTKPKPKK
jgi:hypothetical protein